MQPINIRPRYITRLDQVSSLTDAEREELKPVSEKFTFRTNEYYQSLIDWNDPNDPIRRIVMPDVQELDEFGELDASDESSYTALRGLEHKYADTALLLVNNVCGAYCRFCFRKRLFTDGNNETTNDVSEAIAYIANHPEINNVLLSGGDPLIMSTGKLEKIVSQLRQIDHVRIIRIGSKMVAFDPFRVLSDPLLLEMFEKYSLPGRKIFVMNHFNHPRELTEPALQALRLIQKAGGITVNQTPLIRGVNDKAEVVAELFSQLAYNGVIPYYLFLCRPTLGNEPYVVTIEKALEIFEEARRHLAGIAKQARLCMSHKTGKIEVVGKMGDQIVFRYHRAPNPQDCGRLMIFESDPKAGWLDDYLRPEPALDLSLEDLEPPEATISVAEVG
ncbi:MAG TPA: KamA family radical SAM protein [Pyrinomonadaceae bacterium]|nr:KamA family radical SAM protein [Pyrinomonadaceae bacterium]